MKEVLELKKWMVVKTLISFVGVLIFILLLWPMAAQTRQDWVEIKSRQRKVTEARSWRQVTRRLEQQNNDLRVELARLYQGVPEDEVLSAIISNLQENCKKSGVKLAYLKPSQPAESGQYREVAVELGLGGDYHSVGKFLFLLESSDNVVRVQFLEMSTKGMLSQELEITLKISVLSLGQASNTRAHQEVDKRR